VSFVGDVVDLMSTMLSRRVVVASSGLCAFVFDMLENVFKGKSTGWDVYVDSGLCVR